jgi:signal peptidase II
MERKYQLFGVLALIIFLGDVITKEIVIRTMYYGEVISVLPFFNIVSARNPGAAFGFLAGAAEGFRVPFFFAISIVAFVVIGTLIYKAGREQLMYAAGLGLVLGGALGNFADRVRHGYVVDFLDVFVGAYHWPAFNVADAGISIGVALLILDSIREAKAERAALKVQGAK